MAVRRTRGRRFVTTAHKPHGVIQPRVQRVGPEHFGIVCIDCAKARFRWMLCDFYGKVLIAPSTVEHNGPELNAALAQLQLARDEHGLQDVIVAIERTGRYHRIAQQLFADAGNEVRLVHPFTTKQHRQGLDPGVKTDDTDLAAIHRAAVSGCALLQAPVTALYRELQLLIRQRRDWVRKTSLLCCQIREYLHSAYPGYVTCFARPWHSEVMLALVRRFESAAAMLQAGASGLAEALRQQLVHFQHATCAEVLSWARQAPPADPAAVLQRRIAIALDDDRLRKTQDIQAFERTIAGYLAQTPYVLLLSFPGVNVVSAADFAGEMGPIENYLTAKAITGRAGLYPSRYQSDRVDRADGMLVRCANHTLRGAIMTIADNLISCNHYFGLMSERWRAMGRDPRDNHVRVASRFCRIAFQMVAGRQVFRHPGIQQRHYILEKLNAFHHDHHTGMAQVLEDLLAVTGQLPRTAYAEEARPLQEEHARILAGRRRGPQLLGDILPIVLARLGVTGVQSNPSGAVHPAPPQPAQRAENACEPIGANPS